MTAEVKDRLKDRAKGALWGLIVGDCLGSPYQFGPRVTNRDYQVGGKLLPMTPCELFRCPAGYWTDDGSMALCVMDSFVRKHKFDLEDMAQTFVKWYEKGYLSSKDYAFDVGCATSQALIAFKKKGTLKNGTEDGQGNGAIMRFSPTFFVGYHAMKDLGDLEDRTRHTKAVALMKKMADVTHNSTAVHADVELFATVLRQHLFEGRPTDVYHEFIAETPVEHAPNTGWSKSTLQAGCLYFAKCPTFKDALTAAALAGGDSDTIGAVTGQIAGAYWGYSAIPQEWICAVKDYQKVEALIEQFLESVLLEELA